MLQNFTLGSFAQGVSAGGGAFESIASATPNGANVTFSSIPSTYSALQLRVIGRTTYAATSWEIWMRFNGDSGTNYTYHYLYGDATGGLAGGFTGQTLVRIGDATGSTATASVFGVAICDIHNYASTTQYKTVRAFHGYDLNGSGVVGFKSNLWLSTAAINSITISTANDSFASGTTIALYGIKGA